MLEPTSDVAASPPFVTLAPGLPYVVRVVRTSTRPIAAEESYRLLIDELPEPGRPSGDIRFAVRHSLPVFFRSPDAGTSDVAWLARVDGGEMRLTAANRGDRRLRIANLRVVAADGTPISFGTGLAGYALGHAERAWRGPAVDPRFRLAGAHVEFDADGGPRRADLAASAPAGTL